MVISRKKQTFFAKHIDGQKDDHASGRQCSHKVDDVPLEEQVLKGIISSMLVDVLVLDEQVVQQPVTVSSDAVQLLLVFLLHLLRDRVDDIQ